MKIKLAITSLIFLGMSCNTSLPTRTHLSTQSTTQKRKNASQPRQPQFDFNSRGIIQKIDNSGLLHEKTISENQKFLIMSIAGFPRNDRPQFQINLIPESILLLHPFDQTNTPDDIRNIDIRMPSPMPGLSIVIKSPKKKAPLKIALKQFLNCSPVPIFLNSGKEVPLYFLNFKNNKSTHTTLLVKISNYSGQGKTTGILKYIPGSINVDSNQWKQTWGAEYKLYPQKQKQNQQQTPITSLPSQLSINISNNNNNNKHHKQDQKITSNRIIKNTPTNTIQINKYPSYRDQNKYNNHIIPNQMNYINTSKYSNFYDYNNLTNQERARIQSYHQPMPAPMLPRYPNNMTSHSFRNIFQNNERAHLIGHK